MDLFAYKSVWLCLTTALNSAWVSLWNTDWSSLYESKGNGHIIKNTRLSRNFSCHRICWSKTALRFCFTFHILCLFHLSYFIFVSLVMFYFCFTCHIFLFSQPDIEPAVIKAICRIALELPTLFPSKELKILQKGEIGKVILTRRQLACLVTHMFFCTVLPCSNMRRQVRNE